MKASPMTPKVLALEEARLLGLRRYFTGNPCKHGHVAERLTSVQICVECARLHNRQIRAIKRSTPEGRRAENKRTNGIRRSTPERRKRDNQKRRALKISTPEGRIKERRRLHRLDRARRKSTPERRLKENRRVAACNPIAAGLRSRLGVAVRYKQKAGSAVRDLGCTIEAFREYIAAKFSPGMSWQNWGQWHLDHIVPLAFFDLADREQFLRACHYTNYQPLWAKENQAKGANVL